MRKLMPGHADEIRDLIKALGRRSAEQRLSHKLHCVLLVAQGCSCYEVARWFGESPRTLERWALACGRGGSKSLEPRGGHGRPARLGETALRELLGDLSAPPAAFGYGAPGWSPKLLAQHLGGRYQVSLSLRQCQRVLRRLQAAPPQ